MRLLLSLATLLSLSSLSLGQTFSAFLSRVNSVPNDQRPAIVDSFLQAVPGFPYIEETNQVHFLYLGEATSVTIPGDANQWNPNSFAMNRISGTDLWYHSRFFESDARLDYKFVLNNTNWILDPRNPYTVVGGFGPNSELRMPDFVQPPEIEYYPGPEHGTLRDTLFHSDILGNTRRVRVFIPAIYNPFDNCLPIVLIHDGLDYLDLAHADNILDYLYFESLSRSVIAVFVPPVNRTEEYAGSLQDEFGQFITQELLPWVDSEYNTCPEPHNRGTIGASNGGNISLWLAVTYPDQFGLVGAQSPNVQSSITDSLLARDDLGLRFYVDIGTYDIPQLIPLTENLIQILNEQHYDHTSQVHHDGHSWGNWRAHLDECLIYLFPPHGDAEPSEALVPASFQLAQNFPNPFNPETKLSFTLEKRLYADLSIYDLQGRNIDTLANGILEAGKHEFAFSGAGKPSGIYFARLTAGATSQTIKMLLLK
ncbi:MAG: T9SS type A sorting domain-containing protein [Calditrichaeota bacterium]|nr:T9SS type A sorting domain-containing protein [Calditrichota bacterium]MCB9391799.1 T9SS type A sorting domain-containing protein [Calditrichota bacterium]